MEKTFKTKTGFYHVTQDQIILTRDGIAGNAAKVMVGNSISRILIIYGFLSLALVYFTYDSYLKGDIVAAILLGLSALYLVNGIIKSINNSAKPIIDRKDITAVKFVKGSPGLTRSRFEVEFDEAGKRKKRLILLPGSMTSGQQEAEKAIAIMRHEKSLD
jgi:hypothetical protein